jgi:hypothetical protein
VAGGTRAFLVSAAVILLGAVLSVVMLHSGPNPIPQRGLQPPAGH